MGEERASNYYNKIYAENSKYNKSPEEMIYHKLWNKALQEMIKINPKYIVDLGCGPGYMEELIAGKSKLTELTFEKCFGFDFSEVAINKCREKTQDNEKFVFEIADLTKINLSSELSKYNINFNETLFISFEFLEHVTHDLEILQSIPDNVKILFSVPSYNSKGHVRFFTSIDQIYQRYSKIVHIDYMETIVINNDPAKYKVIYLCFATRTVKPNVWRWDRLENDKPVEMTVGIPALNAEKIIWLALESLANQVNVDFAWELICLEEEAKSRAIIQDYITKLPGCVRIIHESIKPDQSIYNINKYTLMEKWVKMANDADPQSRIFVKQAVDDYSPPNRLRIHYEHFKNPDCYYSTQLRGYFYNIITGKYCFYDGTKKQKQKKTTTLNHLNMALRTLILRSIPLPEKPLLSSNDTYIFKTMIKMIGIDPQKNKIVFTDDEIDPNNWKNGFFTDGCNIISIYRRSAYNKVLCNCMFPINSPTDFNIPSYIMERLITMRNKNNKKN